jgi:hypothetical protein
MLTTGFSDEARKSLAEHLATLPESAWQRPRPSGTVRHEYPHGTPGRTRLDTVQKIRRDEDWQSEQADRDDTQKLLIYNELRKRGYDPFAERINVCGTILGKRVCKNESCGHSEVDTSNCNLYHLCPTCARIRSRKIAAELEAAVRSVKPVSGYSWKLLTVALKSNDSGPREALKKATGAFAKLWRNVLKAPLAGAFRSIEFGPLNGNVHVHCLYYGPWVEKRRLSEAWKRYTGDSYIVDVRRVDDKQADLAGAIQEVTKYVTKMADVSPPDLVDFWVAMRRRQMTQRYGVLRGMKSEREIEDTPEPCVKCGGVQFVYVHANWEVQCSPLSGRGPPGLSTLGTGRKR